MITISTSLIPVSALHFLSISVNGADKDGKIIAMESDWIVMALILEFGDLLTVRGAQFIGADTA